jgi:anaerobic magnesium-protoporphyrin IX monomethyl ester cyclase
MQETNVDVLLITPPCIELYSDMREGAPIYPPLGLACIAALLEKNKFKVKIIDAFAENLGWGEIEKRMRDASPFVVGVTTTTSTFREALKIASIAKKTLPGAKVIAGGVHVTVLPKFTLEHHPEIDIITIGEGDYTTLELVKTLKSGGPLAKVRGIAFRQGKRIVITKPRPRITNMDELPFPARHLLPNNLYRPPGKAPIKMPFTTVMTSRGCPNACVFCASKTMWGMKLVQRSSENVLAEIRGIVRDYRIKEIIFADDTFTINKKRLFAICDGLKEMGLVWGCSSRVNTVDEESIRKMKLCGCVWLEFGIECGSQRMLDAVKKGITIEQAREAMRLARKYKIQTSMAFMIGNIGETREDIEATLRLLKELDGDYLNLSILTPYPGTESYDIALKKGYLKTDVESYKQPKYSDPVIEFPDITGKELKAYWNRGMREFYMRPRFIARTLARSTSSPQEFKKFLRSVRPFVFMVLVKKRKRRE